MWNAVLNINSALWAASVIYLIYAAGASVYYLTPRPIELGVLLFFVLLLTEVTFAVLEAS